MVGIFGNAEIIITENKNFLIIASSQAINFFNSKMLCCVEWLEST